MKKRIFSAALSVVMTLSLIVPALATPSVNVWYSDYPIVYYTPYDGSYYIYNLSTNSSFNTTFRTAVSNARAQWNAVLPIGVAETSFNYALNYVYGGTYAQLSEIFPDLESYYAGQTVTIPTGTTTTVTYNGTNKSVRRLVASSRMCVVEHASQTVAGYKNTATHEMGHLFGWHGHSAISTDVMYAVSSEITSLTNRDKTHLKQIYDLFY